MTVEALTQKYLHAHLVGKASFHCTRRRLTQLFDPIRNVRLVDLTPLEVLTWHQDLRDRPHHANRALGILRAAIRWGVPLGLAKADPTVGVRRHHVDSRTRFLEQREVERLLKSLHLAPLQLRIFLQLTLFTGCRRGEARLARWENINLSEQLWTKPRTKAGRWHTIPLTTQAIEALLQLPRVSPWIFPGMNGRPWSASAVEKAWGKFRQEIGLSDVRLHDLRRTAASHMVIHGENLTVVQQMLDHASLQPTAIYARLNLTALARALQANADRFMTDTQALTNIC